MADPQSVIQEASEATQRTRLGRGMRLRNTPLLLAGDLAGLDWSRPWPRATRSWSATPSWSGHPSRFDTRTGSRLCSRQPQPLREPLTPQVAM